MKIYHEKNKMKLARIPDTHTPMSAHASLLTDHRRRLSSQPDAYLGKNVHLRDTLNNLILSSPQDWQTTVALPWMKIEGVTVAWDEVHFDVRLLQRVPYEGASRMQTSMRRSHRDRVVRRGTLPTLRRPAPNASL